MKSLHYRVMGNKVEQGWMWGSWKTELRFFGFYSWIKKSRCIYVCMYMSIIMKISPVSFQEGFEKLEL